MTSSLIITAPAGPTPSSFTYHHGQHLNMSFDQELELMYVQFEQIGASTLDTIRVLGLWIFPICFIISHLVAYFMNNHQQLMMRLFISVLQKNNLVMLKQVIDDLLVDEEEKQEYEQVDGEKRVTDENALVVERGERGSNQKKAEKNNNDVVVKNNNNNNPKHIAVIMDGNRRYGKQHLGSSLLGHKVGGEKLREFVRWCRKSNVEMLTVYAFSTENWNRPKQEVDLLMDLFSSFFEQMLIDAKEIGIRIRFMSSEPERLPSEIKELMRRVELHTRQYQEDSICVNVCASYGSRSAIEKASLRLMAKNTNNSEENSVEQQQQQQQLLPELSKSFLEREEEEEGEEHNKNLSPKKYQTKERDIQLWSTPDMLIRTSGEVRLSNFMLLELAYTEMFFWNCTWPEVTEEMLKNSIGEFVENRNRRMGK